MIKQNSGVQEIMLRPIEIPDTIMKDLGDYKQYVSIINNIHYQVYEKKIAFFPNKTGPLEISGFYLTGKKQIQSHRRRNTTHPFDLFFNEFRANNPTKQFKKLISPITLQVQKPIKGISPWLPAKDINFYETINNQKSIKPGEPITRTITTTAIGVMAQQIPNILTNRNININAKIYQDPPKFKNKVENNAIIGTRIDTISYIPKHQGQFILPKIELKWWSTKLNKVMANQLNSHKFIIHPLKKIATMPAADAPKNNSLLPGVHSKNKNFMTSINNYLNTNLVLILIALSGWLCSFLLLNKKKKKYSKARKQTKKINHIELLKQSALNNNHNKTAELFIKLIKEKYPNEQLNSLQSILHTFTFPEELCKEIKLLEKACYSQEKNNWKGDNFYSMLTQFFKKKQIVMTKRNHPDHGSITNNLHLI